MNDVMTVVYFKAIERGFSVTPVLSDFSLFGLQFTVRWFGLIAAFGFLTAVIFAGRMAYKWKMNLDKMIDVLIYSTVFGIICARIWFVLFNWEIYSGNIASAFRIWEGGLGVAGGIIGGVAAAVGVCRIRKVNLFNLFDAGAVSLLLGVGIGSWGNYTNQNSFGTNTSLPWGMWSEKIAYEITNNADKYTGNGVTINAGTFDEKAFVHPLFLYESLWCVLGFLALLLICRKFRKFSGQLALSGGIWFGIGHIVIEGLRAGGPAFTDTKIKIYQLISVLLVLVCAAALIVLLRKYKKNPKPVEGVDFFPAEEEKPKTAPRNKKVIKAVDDDEEPDDDADKDEGQEKTIKPEEKITEADREQEIKENSNQAVHSAEEGIKTAGDGADASEAPELPADY